MSQSDDDPTIEALSTFDERSGQRGLRFVFMPNERRPVHRIDVIGPGWQEPPTRYFESGEPTGTPIAYRDLGDEFTNRLTCYVLLLRMAVARHAEPGRWFTVDAFRTLPGWTYLDRKRKGHGFAAVARGDSSAAATHYSTLCISAHRQGILERKSRKYRLHPQIAVHIERPPLDGGGWEALFGWLQLADEERPVVNLVRDPAPLVLASTARHRWREQRSQLARPSVRTLDPRPFGGTAVTSRQWRHLGAVLALAGTVLLTATLITRVFKQTSHYSRVISMFSTAASEKPVPLPTIPGHLAPWPMPFLTWNNIYLPQSSLLPLSEQISRLQSALDPSGNGTGRLYAAGGNSGTAGPYFGSLQQCEGFIKNRGTGGAPRQCASFPVAVDQTWGTKDDLSITCDCPILRLDPDEPHYMRYRMTHHCVITNGYRLLLAPRVDYGSRHQGLGGSYEVTITDPPALNTTTFDRAPTLTWDGAELLTKGVFDLEYEDIYYSQEEVSHITWSIRQPHLVGVTRLSAYTVFGEPDITVGQTFDCPLLISRDLNSRSTTQPPVIATARASQEPITLPSSVWETPTQLIRIAGALPVQTAPFTEADNSSWCYADTTPFQPTVTCALGRSDCEASEKATPGTAPCSQRTGFAIGDAHDATFSCIPIASLPYESAKSYGSIMTRGHASEDCVTSFKACTVSNKTLGWISMTLNTGDRELLIPYGRFGSSIAKSSGPRHSSTAEPFDNGTYWIRSFDRFEFLIQDACATQTSPPSAHVCGWDGCMDITESGAPTIPH